MRVTPTDYGTFYVDACVRALASWAGFAACLLRARIGRSADLDARSIAVVQLGHLGDMVLTLPLLAALKRKYPSARLNVLTGPEGAKVLDAFAPDVERTVYRSARYARQGRRDAGCPSLGEYDLIVHLRGDARLMARYWTNLRAGFINGLAADSPLRRTPLSLLGVPGPRRGVRHQYRCFREQFGRRGIPVDEKPVLRVDPEWARELAPFMGGTSGPVKGYAVLHPGSPWQYKRWPLEHFVEIARWLNREHSLRVAVIGGSGEESYGQEMVRRGVDCVNLAGRLTLRGLAALCEGAAVYCGNDSGPAHVAAAAGTRTAVLYGNVDPGFFGVLSDSAALIGKPLPCSPCWQTKCVRPDRPCVARITPDEVREAVGRLLRKQNDR